MGKTFLILIACMPAALLAGTPSQNELFLGASVYPELQTRAEWTSMLDEFQRAHLNVVRVGESSWGNLETAPGQYNFGWLRDFLDELDRRGMKAILGTSTYIAPQWLAAKHPEVLVEVQPGLRVHPMSRKAASLSHPLYREACRRYITAIGKAFKDHPTVIGWQLDNEIEFMVARPDYNPACERAWHEWLKETYGTPEELNRRLNLVSWGMKVSSFEEIPQPGETLEGHRMLPALTLANLHFRRDLILKFLIEQTEILRGAGVRQWITTDWNTLWTALADDPLARKALDIAGLNFYQPSGENREFWKTLAWHLDMHRSVHGLNRFLVTETRIGVAGSVEMQDAFPSRDQFRMWMLQPLAFGASSLIYWSGNRWRSGHWPHWGGLLDWSGNPEPELAWVAEIGEFCRKWGKQLLATPVDARAAVLTDFDNRAALQVYPHTPASRSVLPAAFDLLHRAGVGLDTINSKDAESASNLARYGAILIPAATTLDGEALPRALRTYAESGGHVLITPFTAYQSWDGAFRSDGFGGNLAMLTGVRARTARRNGARADGGAEEVKWSAGQVSPVGIDGYCELLELEPGVEVLARFQSKEPILNGRPAATRKRIVKGSAVKLGFWPNDDSLWPLIREMLADWDGLLAGPASPGVQAVPRSDKSLFVINTSGAPAQVRFARTATDRLSGRKLSGNTVLPGYGVLWVE